MYEKLDEKYWKKQDYLLYLNNVLANMVKQNNQKTLTQFRTCSHRRFKSKWA